jgi:hypothetical protein
MCECTRQFLTLAPDGSWLRQRSVGTALGGEADDQGPILQNSISAEKNFDQFLA